MADLNFLLQRLRGAELLETLWYENEDGERVPSAKDGSGMVFGPAAPAKYQVSRFPCELHTSYVGQNTDGSSYVAFASTSSYQPDLALRLVALTGCKLGEAIIIAASACERCMNVLAHDVGLDWGYERGSDDFERSGTSCSICAIVAEAGLQRGVMDIDVGDQLAFQGRLFRVTALSTAGEIHTEDLGPVAGEGDDDA